MSKKAIEERQGKRPVALLHENPVLDRIYRNRGIEEPSELDNGLPGLLSPWTMKGMEAAVGVIISHIQKGSRILIVGDYDCDGATATTIAVQGLRDLGAANVDYLVPDRMKHGYGLSPAVVEVAAAHKPELIITVDNGIASFDGAEAVAELAPRCDLVITDHHLASTAGLPKAAAIVNPNQPGCGFESKAIAGCGVMFYTVMALRARMREMGLFEQLGVVEPKLSSLLDVVALGTIADVVPLDRNNRVLVSAGISAINRGAVRPGLRNLLEIGKRRIGDIVTADMGFVAGPRLNAAGRLDDMSLGIQCLLTTNEAVAQELAETLDNFNRQRREMEGEMVDEAVASYEAFETDRLGIVLHDPHWHEGVVGIVASRIKDRLNRPVICFSYTGAARETLSALGEARQTGQNQKVIESLERDLLDLDMKGSARSVPGVHMKHLLDQINKEHPELLSKFGGHAMAAGMTIRIRDLAVFEAEFNRLVSKHLTAEMVRGKVEVDIKDISPDLMNLETAELLRHAAPWGQHFEAPLFSAKMQAMDMRVLQDKHLKLDVRVEGSTEVFSAIAFNCVENGDPPFHGPFEAAFSLDVNEWKGKRSLQLVVRHLQDLDLRQEVNLETEADGLHSCAAMSPTKSSIMASEDYPGMAF